MMGQSMQLNVFSRLKLRSWVWIGGESGRLEWEMG